jgi:uncharacterized Zn finger protein
MKLVEVKCPNCGASVKTTDEMITFVGNIAVVGGQTIECDYCGSSLMTPGTEVQFVDQAGKGAVIIGSVSGGILDSIISSGDVIVEREEKSSRSSPGIPMLKSGDNVIVEREEEPRPKKWWQIWRR